MAEDDDVQDEDPDGAVVQDAVSATERIEQERGHLLRALSAARPETLVHRVAWVLNTYPDTRNSDITLQLHYWETFHSGEYNPNCITRDDLYHLPRLTSLVRARARVQNTLKLFLADAAVRLHRGTLSDEERKDAADAKATSYPVYAIYVDESGKTQQNLLVGSLWILQGPETYRIAKKLDQWRDESKFEDELHFKEVDDRTLPYYKQAVDIVLGSASALSLKYISVPRAGAGDVGGVVAKLTYHLVAEGIVHENESGRAPLPRNLQLWKDAEGEAYDKLVLADLKDRLAAAASARFSGRLVIDLVEAADSKHNDLIQIADLFIASINRVVNPPDPAPTKPSAKDLLSNHVLSAFRLSVDQAIPSKCDDLAVKISL